MDLARVSEETVKLLTKKEILTVNQDSADSSGTLARYYDPWHCLYKKSMADGSTVFLIVNLCHSNSPTTVEAELDMHITPEVSIEIYDLWEDRSLGVYNGVFDIFVETSDVPTTPCCRMLKVSVKS